ncbi:MAG: hypothetical protein U0797_04865 [Gemmataceae bacterium]
MRMLVIALGLCAAFPYTEQKDDAVPKAREVDVKDLKIVVKEDAKPKPVKITSKKELEEAVEDGEAREKIGKQVDFAREYLVLFRWSGSGGDKLSFQVKKAEGGEDAVFLLQPGLTRDLRPHVKLYAIANNVGYKIGT